tara:strand:- start:1055 stop:1330 length:276 start_codon:yes stop_codon:yes gene_type:complete
MLQNILPFIYGIAVLVLLWRAALVMFRGFQTGESKMGLKKKLFEINEDRTGQVTIHPEILNQNGDITDEDLLTVRFSKDVDPPQSADASSE